MRNSKRWYLLIGLASAVLLCGCSKSVQDKGSVEDTESYAAETVAAEEKSTEENTVKEQEPETAASLQEPEKEAEGSDTLSQEQDADTEDADMPYQELLNGIYELLLSEERVTDMELADRIWNGIMDAGYSKTPEELLDSVGYTLWDINGDGIPELVIGGINEEGEGKYFGSDIYAIYTYTEQEVYCLCEGWSRNYIGCLGENKFCCLGSGGASYMILGEYEISPDTAQWTCTDFYFSDENGIYRSRNDECDPQQAEKQDMTWDDLWDLWDETYENVQKFEMIPFSLYTYSGEKVLQTKNTELIVQWEEEAGLPLEEGDEFLAYAGENSARVVFRATDSLADFKVLKLDCESVDENGVIQYAVTELYAHGTLTAKRALIVELIFEGTIPGYGISYVDAEGNTRAFSVNISGYDGSLILEEIYFDV